MAELRYYKTRATKVARKLQDYVTQSKPLDVEFTFPSTRKDLAQYISDQKAQIVQVKFTLTSHIDEMNEAIKLLEEAVSNAEPSEWERLQDDLSAYLEKECDVSKSNAKLLLARFEYRLVELAEQRNVLKETEQKRAKLGDADAQSTDSLSSVGSVKEKRVRLPELTVPTFDGNVREFPSFWTTFSSMVHDNEELGNVDRFLFLKQALKGKALKLIAPLPVLAENYKKAVALLKSRYDKGNCMTDLILADIQTMATADNSTASCRETLEALKAHITLLDCQGVEVDDNPLWRNTVLAKFPNRFTKQILIAERKADRNLEMDEIFEELEDNISLSETVELTTSSFSNFSRAEPEARHKQESSKNPQKREKQRDFQKKTVERKRITCLCGDESHNPFSCPTLTTVDKRREVLKQTKACWKCFERGHSSKDCTKMRKCPSCDENHHSAVCYQKERENQERTTNFTPSTSKTVTTGKKSWIKPDVVNASQCPAATKQQYQVVLMTAQALIFNEKEMDYEPINLFIDSGAQRSFIKTDISTDMKLPTVQQHELKVSGIGEVVSCFTSDEVMITLKNAMNNEKLKNIPIFTKEKLTSALTTAELSEDDRGFIAKNDVYIAQETVEQRTIVPSILVGQDLLHTIVQREKPVLTLPSGLVMTPTVFGYAISGKSNINTATKIPECAEYSLIEVETPVVNQVMQDYKSEVKNLYEIESLGLKTEPDENELEVLEFMKEYRDTILIENNVATAGFPFLEHVAKLNDNFKVAARRLESLLKELVKEEERLKLYENTINDYLQQGIIEEVNKNSTEGITTFYLPHRYVWSPEKSTKLRIVFDAASKARNELSLNDTIFEGHSLMPHIYEILMKFRTHSHVMTADIQKAFLQIRLHPAHRDATRFLWIKDWNKPAVGDNLRYLRFCRIPFGINASPCILNQTILKHLENINTSTSREIADKIYVDNVLMTAKSSKELIKKYGESKEYFSSLGMNLRDYLSNSKEADEKIPMEDRAKATEMKMLGMTWKAREDTLSMTVKQKERKKISKRAVLSQINGACFDPLGLITPLMVKSKIFLQDLHKQSLKWDEPLNEEDAKRWSSIEEEIQDFSIEVPRLVTSEENVRSRRLSVFVDSSKRVYACAAYITTTTNQGTQSVLYTAKAKVAPIKREQTIPKLELLAIFIGMTMTETILEMSNMRFKEVDIFSDSTIALSWVHSGKRLPSFVAQLAQKVQLIKSRITTIRDRPVRFHHVPTDENIADVATRGLTKEEALNSDWWNGPKWLNEPREKWPTKAVTEKIAEETLDTYEVSLLSSEMSPVIEEDTTTSVVTPENVWQPSTAHTFSYRKLKRIVAYALRFIRNCRKGKPLHTKISDEKHQTHVITGEEMALAECSLLRQAQRQIDLDKLVKSCKKLRLGFDENGLLRRTGRLDNSHLSYDAANPIYLPKKCELTRMILEDIHMRRGHCGTNQLVCEARQKFWIPHDRNQCKSVTTTCLACKPFNSYPFQYPDLGQLPKERIQKAPPFSFIGVDYFGPIVVKKEGDDEKIWVALYTCFVTRLVHLEVATDLSAKAFLLNFKRFIARRGVPVRILSDNGTNFQLAQAIIAKGEDQEGQQINEFIAGYNIQWSFIPPAAPFQGGAWERMVGVVKRSLSKTIGKRKLDLETFHTFLCEAEAIVNSRPLTITEFDEQGTIRPIDFIYKGIKYGTDQLNQKIDHDDPDYFPTTLLKSHQEAKQALDEAEKITDKFWEKWKLEYLTALRGSHDKSYFNYRCTRRRPEIGEIVLVDEDNMSPRGHWPKARIIELVHSRDKEVRSVIVKFPNGRQLQRPITRLIPLELKTFEDPKDKNISDIGDIIHSTPLPPERTSLSDFELAVQPTRIQPRRKAKDNPLRRDMSDNNLSKRHTFAPLLMVVTCLLIGSTEATENVLTCVKGGVTIDTTSFNLSTEIRQEICINTKHCEKLLTQSFPFEHSFKPGLLIDDHTVQWRMIENGKQYRENLHCPGNVICELINCFLCAELIGNPQCLPRSSLAATALGMYLILTVIIIAWKYCVGTCLKNTCCRILRKTGKLLLLKSEEVKRKQKRRNSHVENEEIPLLEQPISFPSGRSKLITIIAIIAILPRGETCQYIDTINSEGNHCPNRNSSIESCDKIHSTIITMSASRQEVCLRSRNNNNQITSQMRINLLQIEFECQQVLQYYTRDIDINTVSAKRCPLSGSCTGQTCEKTTSQSFIPEPNDSYRYPGVSRCSASCGEIGCGCLLPLSGCLFSRTYAKPTNEKSYKVIRCMNWVPKVILEYENIAKDGKKTNYDLVLKPTVTKMVDNTNFTLELVTSPITSLTEGLFVQSVEGNNSNVISTVRIPATTNVALKCPTYKDALKLEKCFVNPKCVCTTSELSTNCNCDHLNITRAENELETRLPIFSENANLEATNSTILLFSHNSVAEVSISVSETQIDSVFESSPCTVQLSRAEGCFNCLSGAKTTVQCKSQLEQVISVQCGTHELVTSCGPEKRSSVLFIHAKKAQLYEKCESSCLKPQENLVLEGILSYHSVWSDQTDRNERANYVSLLNLPDIAHILSVWQDWWKSSILAVITVVLLVSMTVFVLPILVQQLLCGACKRVIQSKNPIKQL